MRLTGTTWSTALWLLGCSYRVGPLLHRCWRHDKLEYIWHFSFQWLSQALACHLFVKSHSSQNYRNQDWRVRIESCLSMEIVWGTPRPVHLARSCWPLRKSGFALCKFWRLDRRVCNSKIELDVWNSSIYSKTLIDFRHNQMRANFHSFCPRFP